MRRIDPPYTNWLLFSAMIESFLMEADAQYDLFRIHITYQLIVSLSFFDRLNVLLTNAPSANCVSLSRLK